mmetsp:Transcript_39317/g.98352  ORF Transcript_39317/g.98352 Transcript_39317/m.98352 type:complete len:217 (-) Transcript_39317:294-944(-)
MMPAAAALLLATLASDRGAGPCSIVTLCSGGGLVILSPVRKRLSAIKLTRKPSMQVRMPSASTSSGSTTPIDLGLSLLATPAKALPTLSHTAPRSVFRADAFPRPTMLNRRTGDDEDRRTVAVLPDAPLNSFTSRISRRAPSSLLSSSARGPSSLIGDVGGASGSFFSSLSLSLSSGWKNDTTNASPVHSSGEVDANSTFSLSIHPISVSDTSVAL